MKALLEASRGRSLVNSWAAVARTFGARLGLLLIVAAGSGAIGVALIGLSELTEHLFAPATASVLPPVPPGPLNEPGSSPGVSLLALGLLVAALVVFWRLTFMIVLAVLLAMAVSLVGVNLFQARP